ncbi:MAG: hypothetical protein IJF14_02905 [Clostridia bacterium]|nr:hypothetical protein [Clostridia bacterium]
MKIYETREWKGFGDQEYYHNEYHQEGDEVVKYKCSRMKTFDGKENSWSGEDKQTDSWKTDDPSMPGWLKKYLK